MSESSYGGHPLMEDPVDEGAKKILQDTAGSFAQLEDDPVETRDLVTALREARLVSGVVGLPAEVRGDVLYFSTRPELQSPNTALLRHLAGIHNALDVLTTAALRSTFPAAPAPALDPNVAAELLYRSWYMFAPACGIADDDVPWGDLSERVRTCWILATQNMLAVQEVSAKSR